MTASAVGLDLLQSVLRLELAALALEVKGQRHQGQHQRAAFVRHAGENRRRPGARAPAQSGQEENEVGPGAEGADFFHVVLGRGAAQFGVTPGAKAPCAAGAEHKFGRGRAGFQRLRVRVDGQKLHLAGAGLRRQAGGVAAGAAQADDLERRFSS